MRKGIRNNSRGPALEVNLGRKASRLSETCLPAGRRRGCTAGFTFIELLLVLGVAVILASLGTINIYSYYSREGLSNEVKQMTGMLRNAQSKSMSQDESSRWGVSFRNSSSGRDAYVFFKVDEALFASSSYTDVPGTEVERRTLKSNLEFGYPTSSNNLNIAFTKISGTPSASTSVQVQISSNSSSTKTITISGNGKIDYQ